MYYIHFERNRPLGLCDCGNVDWCDGETAEDVKKRYGVHLHPADIIALEMDD
jgi:hypothetical protein